MRTKLVRSVVVSALACFSLNACDDNPVSEGRDATAALAVNPTFAIIDAADSTRVNAFGTNRYGDPTYATLSATACDATVTVAADPERISLEPPDRWIVIGNALAPSCVVVSGGGFTDTTDVLVVPAGLAVSAAPDTLRAGETGEVVVIAVDITGASVGPFARTDATYSSGNSAVVAVTDDMGSVSSSEAGAAVITAAFTDLAGLAKSVTQTIEVVANVPASAEFDAGMNLGASEVGEESTYEVVVTDANGNQNTNEAEILGVTVASSDDMIATATGELVLGASVQVFVTVTAVGGGQADISGTVQTTEGDLPFTGSYSVVAPMITNIVPPSGAPGEPFTVLGTGLSLPGLTTGASVGPFPAADVVVVSDTELTVTPAYFCTGPQPVVVDVEGVLSNSVDRTEAGAWNADNFESAPIDNDDPDVVGQIQPRVCLPLSVSGSVGPADVDEFFRIVTTDAVTVQLTLDWDDAGNDVDIYVVDGGFTAFVCTDGGTLSKPEVSTCALEANTEYLFWVSDFGPGTSNWTLSGVALP